MHTWSFRGKFIFTKLLIAVGVVWFLSSVISVYALDVVTEETAQLDTQPQVLPEVSVIIDSRDLTVEQSIASIEALRALYKNQIEVYRSSEQQYRIAKTQYFSLQTLAALEEAVSTTREALLNRSRVLVSFVQLLRATLQETQGVELSQKQQAMDRLESVLQKLLAHQDAVLDTQTREAVALRAQEFAILEKELHSTTYWSLSLISLGRVQTIYDQALIVHADIRETHESETVSALIEAERTRAHEETERNFIVIRDQLAEIALDIQNKSIKPDSFTDNAFNRTRDDLEVPYAGLTLLIDYLEELLSL